MTNKENLCFECPKCNFGIILVINNNCINEFKVYCKNCRALLKNRTKEVFKSHQTIIDSKQIGTEQEQVIRERKSESPDLVDIKQPRIPQKIKKIGNYNLLKKIGSGAMGNIYLGEDLTTKKHVAVKLMVSSLEGNENATKRFWQEARVHRNLNHPNIVQMIDCGYCANTGHVYLVMEFIKGITLQDFITENRLLPAKITLQISLKIASALDYALQEGIIHRDLKPENILINKQAGLIKIADFGLGKKLLEEGITLSGRTMGTLFYMPLEQVRDSKKVDHRADIYGLGATMYHMLAGRPPFSEYKGKLAIARAIMMDEPMPIEEYAQNVPGALLKIIQKAMAKNPEQRYQVPKEIIKDIYKILKKL